MVEEHFNKGHPAAVLSTDGFPTPHFKGRDLYVLYPADPRTEEVTMREAMLCARLDYY
jgi:uncharacterized protein with von Willebrand factor type A (vWA) domain